MEIIKTEPESAESINLNNLPKKSRELYEKEYSFFQAWCLQNNVQCVSEDDVVAFFKIQSENKKPSTLWRSYSMIRASLNVYKGVDISKFNKLLEFLRNLSKDYEPKQSKVLEIEDINRFIHEADDIMYLAMKVLLIMGYCGACSLKDLKNMTIDHITFKRDSIFVCVPKNSAKGGRGFAITEERWIDLVKKYTSLRPRQTTHRNLFIGYRHGRCLPSQLGLNTISKMPKIIAEYLELPNPELYTGNCFKLSSVSHLVNKDDSATAKRASTSSTKEREIALGNQIPDKSREAYDKEFTSFKTWCDGKNIKGITENALISYFQMLTEKKKPSTVWTIYSMMKTCLNVYEGVDMTQFDKLLDFLRKFSKGYEPKQSKVLNVEDINRFLEEAQDETYLAIKVLLIMGYSGSCRRNELANMSIDHIECRSDAVLVSLPTRKRCMGRGFAVTEEPWIDLIKKYIQLRPNTTTHGRFFLTYRNGACLPSPIGLNMIGGVPKLIAKFLKLPNPELYTGNCFKRSGAANSGDYLMNVKACARKTPSLVAPQPVADTPDRFTRLPEIVLESSTNIPLSKKSQEAYEKEFIMFKTWCVDKKVQCISENVLITYFKMQSENKKSSTLLATYTRLRTCLKAYENVDASQYKRLKAFIKKFSEDYEPKQSKILQEDDINRFLEEADDKTHLASKVVLIMGYSGACRREDLLNMSIVDVQVEPDAIFVSLPKRTTILGRLFAIRKEHWMDFVKKYISLRPTTTKHQRFFVTYRDGFCAASPYGINSIGKVPKIIAEFLKLPNPELFTGDCFRRSKMLDIAK